MSNKQNFQGPKGINRPLLFLAFITLIPTTYFWFESVVNPISLLSNILLLLLFWGVAVPIFCWFAAILLTIGLYLLVPIFALLLKLVSILFYYKKPKETREDIIDEIPSILEKKSIRVEILDLMNRAITFIEPCLNHQLFISLVCYLVAEIVFITIVFFS